MLDNTRKMLGDTASELRLFAFLTTLISQIVTVAYLVYALICGIGIAALNIAFAAVCVAYAIISTNFFAVKDKHKKGALKDFKRGARIFKFAAKTITLTVSIYGIAISSEKVDAIAIILATLSIVLWIIQLVFELASAYVRYKSKIFMESLRTDFAPLFSAYNKVHDTVKNVAEVAADVGAEVVEGVKIVAAGVENVVHGVGNFASRVKLRREQRRSVRENLLNSYREKETVEK